MTMDWLTDMKEHALGHTGSVQSHATQEAESSVRSEVAGPSAQHQFDSNYFRTHTVPMKTSALNIPSDYGNRRKSSVKREERMKKSRMDYEAENVGTVKAMGYQMKLGTQMDAVDLLGLEEISYIHFYRQLLTEFFGTFTLVLIGCNCITPYRPQGHDAHLSMASILLGWGFIVASLVWTIAHVSGCFLNPAVTMSMFCNRRIPLIRAIFFIAVQVPGATAGSFFHTYLRGDKLNSTCQTLLNRGMGVDETKGFIVEFLISFFLLFFVFATTDHKRQDHGGSHAMMVGGVIIALVNFAAEMTGAGMNPARSMGPAIVHGNWDAHWIYWVAPITGGVLGGLFYDLVFSERVIAWQRFLHIGDEVS